MKDNGYAVLDYPGYVFFIRIAQVVIAIIALGLAAYAASVFGPFDAYVSLASEGLTIFTAVATWIILVYIRVTLRVTSTQQYYNYFADIACQGFLVIFWLVSMAVSAQWAAANSFWVTYYYNPYDGFYRLSKRVTFDQLKSARNCVAAAAGMAGIELVLFAITLAITILTVQRHMSSTAGNEESGQPPVSMQTVGQEEPKPTYPAEGQQQPQAYQAPQGPTYQAPGGPTYQPEQTQAYVPPANEMSAPHAPQYHNESNPTY